MGAVLGTLIFGVLRNALPQIPGATFYDRLIVGVVVIVIVVMDQLLLQKELEIVNRGRASSYVSLLFAAVCGAGGGGCGIGCPGAAADDRCARRRASCASRDPEGARHPGLQLREDRRRARGEGIRRRRGALERAGHAPTS